MFRNFLRIFGGAIPSVWFELRAQQTRDKISSLCKENEVVGEKKDQIIQDLVQNLGIHKECRLFLNCQDAFALGPCCVNPLKGAALIVMPVNQSDGTYGLQEENALYEEAPHQQHEEDRGVLAHELVHIKHHDVAMTYGLAGAAGSASALVLGRLQAKTRLGTFRLGLIKMSAITSAFFATSIFYLRWTERRADLEGFKALPYKERNSAGLLKSLQRMQANTLAFRHRILENSNTPYELKIFFRMVISDKGDNHLDVFHPLYSERIKYLEEALVLNQQHTKFRYTIHKK